MRKLKKALCFMLTICLLIIGGSSMAAMSFAETIETEVTESEIQTNQSNNINSQTAITSPICTIYSGTKLQSGDFLNFPGNVKIDNAGAYNCAVVWRWETTNDLLAISTNDLNYTKTGKTEFMEYDFPDFLNSTECEPQYKYAYAYSGNSHTDPISITWEKYKSEIEYQIKYEYNCLYYVKGHFDRLHHVGATVPTSYDQLDFIWEHDLTVGKTIYGTVAYDGAISDIEVKVPLFGYSTSKVKLNGVEFSLRTGPNKVSIKASSEVSTSKFMFAFGINKKIYKE